MGAGAMCTTCVPPEGPRLMRMASSPSRISISERLDSSSISISFLTLRMSMMNALFF
jgi:hypothetical protein